MLRSTLKKLFMIIGSGEILGAPEANFSRGLLNIDLQKLADEFSQVQSVYRGKVRDVLVVDTPRGVERVMVTTDRLSAYDRLICTIPGKGEVLSMMSNWWFAETRDIVPNHFIAAPHPNVLIAKPATATLPVEVVLRRYMAKSATSTSVYSNYQKGRREIYGIKFPNDLRANQEFPTGTILTPTTKAETGHDEELTDAEATKIVNEKLGEGVWEKTKTVAHKLFKRAWNHCMQNGLILVDTKYEFGLDDEDNLMLIDEIHTPDSSRFWYSGSYQDRFERGLDPENFDKELIRRWLAEHGFKGEGKVPVVDPKLIDKVAEAYKFPYQIVTGKEVSGEKFSTADMRKILLSITT